MSRPKSPKREYARGVCDHVTNNGIPDVYNYVPTRAVSIDEARLHKWPHFWDKSTACSMGHIAARYVSNPAMCIDCNRIAQGKPPIYPNTSGDKSPHIPQYVEPIANRNFEWTEEKQKQFFTAYVNTCSVPEALKAIFAQMSHLLQIRRDNAAFREEMDRIEATDVRQAQFYRAEDAALSNDRMQQLLSTRKFPDSFGSGAQNGLGRAEIGTPEQIDAEFAQLLRGATSQSGTEEQSLVAVQPGSEKQPGASVVAHGEGGDSGPDPSGRVPAQDDPNSDLVS